MLLTTFESFAEAFGPKRRWFPDVAAEPGKELMRVTFVPAGGGESKEIDAALLAIDGPTVKIQQLRITFDHGYPQQEASREVLGELLLATTPERMAESPAIDGELKVVVWSYFEDHSDTSRSGPPRDDDASYGACIETFTHTLTRMDDGSWAQEFEVTP